MSAEYLAHATAEHGPLGSVPTHIHAAGEAVKNQVIGLANADKTLSIASTGNLADFTVDAQSAASKAAKSGVAAEGAYDLARAQAKRDYNNAIVDAGLIQTTAVQDANLAYTLATPYPLPENWESTTEAQDLLATRDAAHLAAATTHTNSVKAAKLAHATTIGNAQIARAEALGDALIAEATETGDAEIGFVTAQSSTEQAFEGDVTLKEVAGTTGIVAGDGVYKNSHQTNDRNLTAGVGAALVQFAIDMKPVNVNHTAGIVAAEGVYHTATASRIASRHTAYAAGFPAVSPQGFNAAQANAESQWIASVAPAATAYATALATAEADEGIALAQAQADYENARADADVIYVAASQAANSTHAIGSTTASGDQSEDETAALGERNGAIAEANQEFDAAEAAAVRTQAVAYAQANKVYWVALFGLGVDSVPPEHPLELARKVAQAEADLQYAESLGDAEVEWVSDVAAAEKAYAIAVAGSLKTLNTQTALLQKNQIVAGDGIGESKELAYVTAETNLWLAQTTAANNRRSSETLALADFRGADYSAKATAIASIDTAMDLPWTQYIAAKAAAESSWWTTSEHDNILALSAATNSADLAYETTVIAAYTTWATLTAAAERAYSDARAEQDRQERVARAAADETYATTRANAEETWNNGRAANLKNRRSQFYSDRRDAIAANDTTFVALWELIVMMPMPGDAEVDRALEVAEVQARGQWIVSEETATRNYVTAMGNHYVTYISAVALAEEVYGFAETTAGYNRGLSVAAAIENHSLLESGSREAALESLAAAQSSPWSDYDFARAQADNGFIGDQAAASHDLALVELLAERDFAFARIPAERALIIARAQAEVARTITVAEAELTRTTLEAQALSAAVTQLPATALAGATPAGAPSGDPSTPSTSSSGASPQSGTPGGHGKSEATKKMEGAVDSQSKRANAGATPASPKTNGTPQSGSAASGAAGPAAEPEKVLVDPTNIPQENLKELERQGDAVLHQKYIDRDIGWVNLYTVKLADSTGHERIYVLRYYAPGGMPFAAEELPFPQFMKNDFRAKIGGAIVNPIYGTGQYLIHAWNSRGGWVLLTKYFPADWGHERAAEAVYAELDALASVSAGEKATFVLHAIPLGAAADQYSNGEFAEGTISLAADATLVAGPLAKALQAAKYARAANTARRAGILIEFGVAGYRGYQGLSEFYNGEGGLSHLGEALLRLFGGVATIKSKPNLPYGNQKWNGLPPQEPELPPRSLTPVTDKAPPTYKKGHAGKPVIDHRYSRAIGRAEGRLSEALDPSNEQILPWEWNSRKGYYEGQYLRDRQALLDAGFTEAEAEFVLEGDLNWIMNDVLARPTDPDILDKYYEVQRTYWPSAGGD